MPIKVFVKYDELEEIPKLKTVFVDGVPVCLSGLKDEPNGIEPFSDFSSDVARPSGIRLQDLPFDGFPSVTLLPSQVNNVSFIPFVVDSLTFNIRFYLLFRTTLNADCQETHFVAASLVAQRPKVVNFLSIRQFSGI